MSTTPAGPILWAPWLQSQLLVLLRQRGHAWLLHGPAGLGQYSLAMALVGAWLCEQPQADGSACAQCGSCHALKVRTHADFKALLPESLSLELGWPLDEKAQQDIEDKKRKASQEIRIEAMRETIEFAQRTNARGRGKAVLIYPAERMNHVTANALLKTLEEPPGHTRFVLVSESAGQLLPTLRSRCLQHSLSWPEVEQTLAWLQTQGVEPGLAQKALQMAGGRPEEAWRGLQDASALPVSTVSTGKTGTAGAHPAQSLMAQWEQVPKAMKNGPMAFFANWSPVQLLEVQQKLCHDLALMAVGASPRFFPASSLPPSPNLQSLSQWWGQLRDTSRHADHPFKAELMREAWLHQAQQAMSTEGVKTRIESSPKLTVGRSPDR